MIIPPHNIPDLPSADELIPFLRRIDTARWYTNFGPLVGELEQLFANHLSAQTPNAPVYVTTAASGYSALVLGLQSFRLPPGAPVLIPAVTFPACPLAVRAAGGTPILADIDPHSWALTPSIARAIAARRPLGAVMPVALYGIPVSTDAWDDFTADTGIPVLIDAAAAFDVQPVPQHCLAAYSLHATKPFGIGEGGLLAGRNAQQIGLARTLSNFGTQNRIAVENGLNAKLSEYHAAVGLAQFARWHEVKSRRRAVFAHYRTALAEAGLEDMLLPGTNDSLVSSLMLFLTEGGAEEVAAHLQANGVSAHRTYLPPLYKHPEFAALPCLDAQGEARATLPGAALAEAGLVGLPFHGFMKEVDVSCVVAALTSLVPSAAPRRASA